VTVLAQSGCSSAAPSQAPQQFPYFVAPALMYNIGGQIADPGVAWSDFGELQKSVRDLIAMLSIVFIGLFWCPSYAWYR
jgi:hypothetical protein